MNVKEESGKVGLKLNIQKTKIMACESWIIKKAEHQRMDAFEYAIYRYKRYMDV